MSVLLAALRHGIIIILKRLDHAKSSMRPDVFVKKHFPILKGHQHAFVDAVNNKKQKQ